MLVLCSNSVTDINIDVTSNNIINKLNVIDALKLICVGGFHVIPLLGVQAGLSIVLRVKLTAETWNCCGKRQHRH